MIAALGREHGWIAGILGPATILMMYLLSIDVSEALDCASSLRQGDAAAAERDEASLHLPPSPAPRTGEGDGSLAAPAQPPSPSAPTPSSPDGLRCENCGRPVENDERFCHLCDGRD